MSRGTTWTRRVWGALLAPLVAAGAALSVTTADAGAARYVARPADGTRIVLRVDGGRLRRVEAMLPARCENDHGGSWSARLRIDLTSGVALRSGRFGVQGQAPNEVRCQLGGRLRDGAISGRVRLTFLDLDFVGPSDASYVCDTGTRRVVDRTYTANSPPFGGVVVTLRVTDFPIHLGAPAEAITTRTLVLIGPRTNRPPIAGLTVRPNPARVGERVVLDATASTDPDSYDNGRITYGFDVVPRSTFGDVNTFATFTDFHTHLPIAPGSFSARVRVRDQLGRADEARVDLDVVGPSGPGSSPPTASFTITPNPAGVGSEIVLDASASSDADGPIARYEWDLDGNGSFEADSGDAPARFVSFPAQGERIVGLRVTDGDGVAGTAITTISIVDPTLRAPLALPRKGAGARLRASGSGRFRLERDGSATILGQLTTRTGRARPLPTTCRRHRSRCRGPTSTVLNWSTSSTAPVSRSCSCTGASAPRGRSRYWTPRRSTSATGSSPTTAPALRVAAGCRERPAWPTMPSTAGC